MQALVVSDAPEAQVALALALLGRGFVVATAGTVEHALAYAGTGAIDLVVMAERVGGRLSHSVALAAELRNPAVTTMMLTPRKGAEVEELYQLLPSLYCLLEPDLPRELVARLAVAGVRAQNGDPAGPNTGADRAGITAKSRGTLGEAQGHRAGRWRFSAGCVCARDAVTLMPSVPAGVGNPTLCRCRVIKCQAV
ncbi:hypothetical protein N4R57_08100 [Rhodobacteraceae bacterium D3-12]|nr:hypothetical protein N4R57_08100 [Rhodobacteraceae bacterium D3-12]